MKRYHIHSLLTIPAIASERYQDLSLTEVRRKEGCRVIGGDKGDLHFDGYIRNVQANETALVSPVLVTSLELTDDEATDIATEVLRASFESIGAECIEHS